MCHAFLRDARFWTALLEIDRDIAERAREGGCGLCGGPLHRACYERKPRGVKAQGLSLEFCYRLSFCCGRDGCRRRLTPASVRFLGAKVYVGAVVVLVTAMLQGPTPPGMRRLHSLFGANRRTVARWQKLWRKVFPSTKFWATAKAQFMPPVDDGKLPHSLMERFGEATFEKKLQAVLQFLAPITIPGGLAMSAR